MVFPIPTLGTHTAIFGGVGTGKSSLLKGISVEAARAHHVYYFSLEDTVRQEDFARADVKVMDPAILHKPLPDRLAESILAIDALHFVAMYHTPFGREMTSVQKVAHLVKQANAMGSSLIVTFQLNRSASEKPAIVRENAPWEMFGDQWALLDFDPKAKDTNYLRAKCMRSTTAGVVGQVFNFQPWR